MSMIPNSDIVRVLRIIQYEGPRDWVEATVARSIHGRLLIDANKHITGNTLGEFPEVMGDCNEYWRSRLGAEWDARLKIESELKAANAAIESLKATLLTELESKSKPDDKT